MLIPELFDIVRLCLVAPLQTPVLGLAVKRGDCESRIIIEEPRLVCSWYQFSFGVEPVSVRPDSERLVCMNGSESL